MSAWSLSVGPAEAREAWGAWLTDASGSVSRLSLWEDGSAFCLRREGMSVAARASLTLASPAQAREAARLWRALAEDERERFSESGAVGSIPLYALRKPPYEGEPETGVFGINGGGMMGLTPCASFSLPRDGWAAMARLGEALERGLPKARAGAAPRQRPSLSEGALKALVESLELWALSAAGPEPAKGRSRPGL